MSADLRRYPSRKRSHCEDGGQAWAEDLVHAAASSKKMLIFSGSGLSATSGMSMFSTKNGLYERAKKKFKLQDGVKLFCYAFYKQRKADVQAFFAQIYSEAQSSQAAPGHYAIQSLHALGRLQRHYTLNIDGLGEVVGMDTWHNDYNPQGSTVEMHGNIRQLVCPCCRGVGDLTRVVINQMKAKKKIMCENCNKSDVRFKVMLYDDDEGDCITPEHVFETLEGDLGAVDLLLWVGISFEQSASVEYFRRVRHMLSQQGRLSKVKQVIINPSDEAMFNVLSACCNTDDLQVMEVRATSDQALPLIAQQLQQQQQGEQQQEFKQSQQHCERQQQEGTEGKQDGNHQGMQQGMQQAKQTWKHEGSQQAKGDKKQEGKQEAKQQRTQDQTQDGKRECKEPVKQDGKQAGKQEEKPAGQPHQRQHRQKEQIPDTSPQQVAQMQQLQQQQKQIPGTSPQQASQMQQAQQQQKQTPQAKQSKQQQHTPRYKAMAGSRSK